MLAEIVHAIDSAAELSPASKSAVRATLKWVDELAVGLRPTAPFVFLCCTQNGGIAFEMQCLPLLPPDANLDCEAVARDVAAAIEANRDREAIVRNISALLGEEGLIAAERDYKNIIQSGAMPVFVTLINVTPDCVSTVITVAPLTAARPTIH